MSWTINDGTMVSPKYSMCLVEVSPDPGSGHSDPSVGIEAQSPYNCLDGMSVDAAGRWKLSDGRCVTIHDESHLSVSLLIDEQNCTEGWDRVFVPHASAQALI